MTVCDCPLRQQLQELRLKQEQKEREQKGSRRRDLQGESAGERAKPHRVQVRQTNSNSQQVTVSHITLPIRFYVTFYLRF